MNFVASCSPSNSIGIWFMGAMVGDNAEACGFFPRGSSDQWTKAIALEGVLALFPTRPSVSRPISSMFA